MCGIFGFISKDVKKVDSNAFKILGILNEKRGEQSCGITLDSEIFTGTAYGEKLFRDFVKGLNIQPEENPVLIGHTRKSSSGVVNEYNAHPFGFGTNKKNGGFAFIGAHNGTLYNDDELAKEFNISTTVETKNGNTTHYRKKIDSELLLESIYESKSFKPLNFYNGGAALVWYTPDNNTVYLFSGESKQYDSSSTTSIERPLHVLIIDKDTFAFSSEGEPLEVIGGLKKEIFQIETNTVYAIKDGDFENAVKTKVSRINNTNRKETVSNYAHGRFQGNRHSPTNYDANKELASQRAQSITTSNTKADSNGTLFDRFGLCKPIKPELLVTSKNRIINIAHNIAENIININNYKKNRIYFREGRYFRNGHHAVTGVYTLIGGYGLKHLGTNYEEVRNLIPHGGLLYFDITTDEFLTKEQYSELKDSYKSNRIKILSHIVLDNIYFIYKGYMLLTYLDYLSVMRDKSIYESSTGEVKLETISHITKFPVFTRDVGSFYRKYIKEGKVVENDTMYGPNFECVYKIENGRLIQQIETPRPYLQGVDIVNTDEYEQSVVIYNKEYTACAEKERLELENKEKEFDVITAKNFLKDYNLTHDIVCTSENYSDLNVLIDDIVDHYHDYTDDCLAARCDIGIDDFLDNVKMSCRQIGFTLDEVVFDIVTIMKKRKEEMVVSGTTNRLTGIYTIIGKILLENEKTY